MPTTQRRSRYLIYSEITTFVPTQIFFMLHMKNIDCNNSKYTKILIKNTKILGQHVKLPPVPATQRRNRYLIYSEINTFVPIQIFFMPPMKNITPNNIKYIKIITKNTLISGQHVKLLPGPTTQRRSRYLIYLKITTFVPTQIFFMIRIKNIGSNNIKYTEILTEYTKISGHHVKLLPMPTTQRRSFYLTYSKITIFVPT